MSQTDTYTDVVELCALLQCLGFTVKSLDTSDGNLSQDGSARTVVINCQSSGLHVVLESGSLSCSCPAPERQNSGFWQVCGVARGKQAEKETGSAILGSLPKAHRDRLSKELREMVRCIKEANEAEESNRSIQLAEEGINKSASMVELKTPPEKKFLQPKVDTPTRYRSLDTLTSSAKDDPETLPAPGLLQKHTEDLSVDDEHTDSDKKEIFQTMCRRQSTYTINSTPGSIRRRNKTSSPIQNTVLDTLIAAERAADDLRNKLAVVIRELMEDGKHDSSMSSLALDVSKISVLKGPETTKAQFASSPNLSGVLSIREDLTKSRLKRLESASTSNLVPTPSDAKPSRLRRISPNIFNKMRKDSSGVKADKDGKISKLNSLFKSKIDTPVRVTKFKSESSPNLSASKRKFSHIKSTIPRLITKKE